MALSFDLLNLADDVLPAGPGRPVQARLRRAVSTAYYALFHALIEESTRWLAGTGARTMRQVMARGYEHGAMRDFAERVVHGRVPDFVQPLLPAIPPDLARAVDTFVKLQSERHRADYDWANPYTKVEVVRLLRTARAALDEISGSADGYSDELRHFLMILPMWAQLRRRA